MAQYFAYIGFRLSVFLIRLVPFPLLYFLSRGIAFSLQHILRYRRQVIKDNLRNSFPQVHQQQLIEWEHEYYQHLARILLESIKGLTISQDKLKRRYLFRENEQLRSMYHQGKSVILVGAHYNNWEWGAQAISMALPVEVVAVYKQIKNRYIDSFIRKRRKRYGLTLSPMNTIGRKILEYRDTPAAYIFIADQSPGNARLANWHMFLHRETGFLKGYEKIAMKYNYPVFMYHIKRIRGGFYEVSFTTLDLNPSASQPGSITKRYAQELEEIIQEKPSFWLWSHRRWKKQRPNGVGIY